MRIFFFDRELSGFSAVVAVVAHTQEAAQAFLAEADPKATLTPRVAPFFSPNFIYSAVSLEDAARELLSMEDMYLEHKEGLIALEGAREILRQAVGSAMAGRFLMIGDILITIDDQLGAYVAASSVERL